MPSSFSPSLRLELIGAGEQAGTWGTTTNTNLGTLVEDAISGYVAVTPLSTNQALTAANGAADQARNAIVELTSSPGADFAIYAPPESKQYTIVNSTVNTATIYNSTSLGNTTAAGTGVAIPAGRTITVWSDGVNFSVQNDLLIGNVVGNVVGNVTGNITGNITGQLSGTIASGVTGVTQSSGTNNTTMATTAFVQAAFQALHPVGSIYINATNNTNPGTLLGFGTWTAFGAGRVPVGFNASDPDFDTAEETGGSKTHSHNTESAGTHDHSIPRDGWGNEGGSPGTIQYGRLVVGSGNGEIRETLESLYGSGINNTSSTAGAHTHTVTSASSLQPYITVYMWKRTA